MFRLSEKNQIDRIILKCDYIRYSPSEISTINTPNSQIYINIPGEDSVISLLTSYIELNFDVLHAASGNRYGDGNAIRLVNLGPIALFIDYKLTTSSGKHKEKKSHAHIDSLMYKLLTSSEDSDDLSIGFDRSRNRRGDELTTNKNVKGKFRVRIYLKAVLGLAEHQETGTFGLGYRLILTRNTDNTVLNRDNTTSNAKVKVNALKRCVPNYTPNLEKYIKLMNQIAKKTPTELDYPEKSVFMKEVFWTFELGTQEGINVPIWIYVVLQHSDGQHDQNLKIMLSTECP